MRLKVQPVERAMLRASIVLPTPGTSSMRMCPWHRRPMTLSRTSWVLSDDNRLDVGDDAGRYLSWLSHVAPPRNYVNYNNLLTLSLYPLGEREA